MVYAIIVCDSNGNIILRLDYRASCLPRMRINELNICTSLLGCSLNYGTVDISYEWTLVLKLLPLFYYFIIIISTVTTTA